ncbi:MAG TPA: tRNA lysidine(34) synthetase TilS [Pyrinomonadaceae bacterium]|nr:tRNA lysidine(34) synthetase TilS [Pyrinomonadaceae bacterium]
MKNISREQSSAALQERARGARTHTSQRLSRFAGALLKEWKRLGLPVTGERVVVAVSGGADSVALLLALCELVEDVRLDLIFRVAHLNHGLRGKESAEDARYVERLVKELGVEGEINRISVAKRAAETGDNLEQAARRARYKFLEGVAKRCRAPVVLTAHTMDDQAETVMLRLLRGSGAEGLSGIERVRPIAESSRILLVRPLLGWARRADTERYCRASQVEFRVDSMNEDERFARVRVRRKLLPLMESFNPKIVESLSRTAEILRADSVFLNAAAEELLKMASEENEVKKGEADAGSLDVNILLNAPLALRRRALRLWLARGRGDLRRLELVHLLGIEKLLAGERGGRVAELPGGSFVERRRGRLRLHVKN